jgi:fructoselysine 6-kinase
MAARLRIAAVGEVGLDLYEELGRATLGGCSCNVARAAAAAGATATLFAAVGDDLRGRDVQASLASSGLDLRVRVETGTTALQRIRVDPDGERRFCGWEPGVIATYRLTDAELAALRDFDVIALADTPAWDQCVALTGPRLVAYFSQDAETAWRFDGLDIAFVGGVATDLDRLRPLARDRLVVLTAGAAGAWAIDRDRVVHQPSVATRIVDTTGCGDAFQAAFIVAYFSGSPVETALLAGARAAMTVASQLGAG